MTAIENTPPDAAILDLNLGGMKVFPVAEKLDAAGIPFVFATGGGLDVEGFSSRPIISKPFRESDALNSVAQLIGNLQDFTRKSAE